MKTGMKRKCGREVKSIDLRSIFLWESVPLRKNSVTLLRNNQEDSPMKHNLFGTKQLIGIA